MMQTPSDSIEVVPGTGMPPVTVRAHVGRPRSSTREDGPGIAVLDHLVILTQPGALPESLSVGSGAGATVNYQGRTWRPISTQITHRVHGRDHHTSVTVEAETVAQ